MKTLLGAIQKGGQGKSMLAAHMAFYGAELGYKVLAVDLDGQGNLSRNLCTEFDKDQAPTVGLFEGATPVPVSVPLPKGTKGRIDLITGDHRLVLVDETPAVKVGALRDALGSFKGYDLCLIDPPPTLGKRLRAALIAADFVYMPFVPARESVDGLGDLLDTIAKIKNESNPRLHQIGLLPNKVNSRSLGEKQILDSIRKAAPGMLMPISIHERTSIATAMGVSRPVWRGGVGESARLGAAEVKAACAHIFKIVLKKHG